MVRLAHPHAPYRDQDVDLGVTIALFVQRRESSLLVDVDAAGGGFSHHHAGHRHSLALQALLAGAPRHAHHAGRPTDDAWVVFLHGPVARDPDRKSTRLNSSHRWIS